MVVAAGLTVVALTACTGQPSGAEGTIALLLPDAKTARYETFDRPFFEERIAELGDYRVLYANADQDAAKQQQQAESALDRPARACSSSTPSTSRAAVSIVTAANDRGVPVVSYDRLVAGGDLAYYVSFDNEKVGVLQATAFVDALDAAGDRTGGILMVNGSPTDSNATSFARGAHSVIDQTRLQDPRRVCDARLEPRQGPGVGVGADRPVRQTRSSGCTPRTTARRAGRSRRSRPPTSIRGRS